MGGIAIKREGEQVSALRVNVSLNLFELSSLDLVLKEIKTYSDMKKERNKP
jgi:hypothetical protein